MSAESTKSAPLVPMPIPFIGSHMRPCLWHPQSEWLVTYLVVRAGGGTDGFLVGSLVQPLALLQLVPPALTLQ